VGLFTLLSGCGACLGLFGWRRFQYASDSKNAVRKVLGAGVGNLTGLLARNFRMLVLISALLAFPLRGWESIGGSRTLLIRSISGMEQSSLQAGCNDHCCPDGKLPGIGAAIATPVKACGLNERE